MNYLNFLVTLYSLNEDIGDKNYVVREILNKTPYDRIFLGSDWHLFKKEVTGIPEKESNFDLSKYIIRHNFKVRNNDVFIYLGDLAHRKCSPEHYIKLRNFVNKLNGIKILIKGNHDKEIDDYYLSCGFNFVFETLQFKNILFSHRPKDLREFPGVKYNIHGHLHEYKIYRTGINPKNHIGIYSKNHEVLSLKYILDHRKEIESENIDIYKQYDKPLNDYKNDVKRYIKICKKFFKTNPEYLNMSKEKRYFKQEEMIRKFLKMQEVQSDEGLIGWKQTKMDNIKDFNKLSYKPVGINDYCHFVILNKDSNLIIDLNPDLIDWDGQYVYSQGKNMIKFKWSICKILYHWNSKETGEIPQTQWLQVIKEKGLNETLL